MNKDEHNSYDGLTNAQQIAVDMRLAGKTYSEIASHIFINMQEHTIRTWFMKKGICYDAFQWKKKIKAEEREEFYSDLESEMKEIGREAMHALRESISRGNTTAVIKGLEISGINRYQIRIKTDEEDEAIKMLRSIIEERREVAKKERENKNV